MGTTGKKQAKWFISLKSIILKRALVMAVAILAVVLISIIAVQVGPDSSEATSRIDAIESGFTEETPRIEAMGISGSGESFIMIEGEIFHEGNFVKGFKIKKIDGRTVEFQKDGQIWVQHMD